MTPQAEFLRLDETRGVRLQLEYLEVEIELKKHDIRHTVCVFGSTRTQAAHRHYEEARLFETLTLVQTGKIRPLPVVLVCKDYWARAVDFDFMVAQGTIAQSDRELFCSAEDGESAWHAVAAWYARHGDEVFPSKP